MEEKRDIIITRTDKNSWDYITYEGLRPNIFSKYESISIERITLPMRD